MSSYINSAAVQYTFNYIHDSIPTEWDAMASIHLISPADLPLSANSKKRHHVMTWRLHDIETHSASMTLLEPTGQLPLLGCLLWIQHLIDYFASVPVIYAISYNIWLRYNGTRLYHVHEWRFVVWYCGMETIDFTHILQGYVNSTVVILWLYQYPRNYTEWYKKLHHVNMKTSWLVNALCFTDPFFWWDSTIHWLIFFTKDRSGKRSIDAFFVVSLNNMVGLL